MKDYDGILIFRIDALRNAIEQDKVVKTIVVTYGYITAVQADGFIGYLYSHSGDYASQLIASLEEIGVPASVKIAQDVLAFFPASKPAVDLEKRASQLADIIEKRGLDDPWEDLNRDFIDSIPELEIQFSAYVNRHSALIRSFPEDDDQKQTIAGVMKKMKWKLV